MKPGLIGIAIAAAALTGCGHAAAAGQSDKSVTTLPATTVPATVGGLDVQAENVTSVLHKRGTAATYASSVGYWSLRRNKLVQATLQITKLNSSARLNDPAFVKTLVQAITSTSTPTRIGAYDVYLGQGMTVNNAAWFEGPYLFELNTRPTYAFPRTLLEGAVAVHV